MHRDSSYVGSADYSDEELEFIRAMERYQRVNRRRFPTWSETLEVLLSLGYRKVEEPREPRAPRDGGKV